jgi:hypothetical protein
VSLSNHGDVDIRGPSFDKLRTAVARAVEAMGSDDTFKLRHTQLFPAGVDAATRLSQWRC